MNHTPTEHVQGLPPHQMRPHFFHMVRPLLLTAGLALLDLLITIISFGFYDERTHSFSLKVLRQNLFPFTTSGGYYFTGSPFELLIFSLARALFTIYTGAIATAASVHQLGSVRRAIAAPTAGNAMSRVLVSLQLVNFTYTVLKFLAFSEHNEAELLRCVGAWTNCVWNVGGLFLVYLVWNRISHTTTSGSQASEGGRGPRSNGYQALRNETDIGGTQNDEVSGHPGSVEIGNGNHQAAGEPPTANGAVAEQQMAATRREGESPGVEGSEQEAQESLTSASTLRHMVLLAKYSFCYWQWLLAGFTFLLIYSIARILIPYCTAEVVDNIVGKEQLSVFLNSILVMAVLSVISTIFAGLRGGCFTYAGALISNKIRQDVFAAITRQEIGFFDATQTGEVLSRLTSDCDAMTESMSLNINLLARNTMMVLGSFGCMAALSWRLTLVTVAISPTMAYFVKIYSVYFDRLTERTRTRVAEATQSAEEVIGTMRTVRSFAAEKHEGQRYDTRLAAILHVRGYEAFTYCAFTCFNELTFNVTLIAVLLYGGHLVLAGRMTSQAIVAFLLYQMQLADNFSVINYGLTGMMKSVGASRKIFQYLHRQPAIDLDGGDLPESRREDEELSEASSFRGKLSFHNVSFAYPTRPETEVLHDVSFTVEAGETVALVGPSGSGKSSIVALTERFYEPCSGEIRLDEVPISRFKHPYYHGRCIALVAQEPVLYAGSIRYNILYGLVKEEDEKAAISTQMDAAMVEAAHQANIHTFISSEQCRDGYETRCGERGTLMSGGQKQRIAIARALVRKPAVLILDEATSALDSESEHLIQQSLRGWSKRGRTVLVIAHRLSTVERADRILVVERGRIVQQGSHTALMQQRDGLYYQLVQRQLRDSDDNEGNAGTSKAIG